MCRCCVFSLGILTCGSGPLLCMAVIFRKKYNISYQFRLVNAMHRNGPLTQVNNNNNSSVCYFKKNKIKKQCTLFQINGDVCYLK